MKIIYVMLLCLLTQQSIYARRVNFLNKQKLIVYGNSKLKNAVVNSKKTEKNDSKSLKKLVSKLKLKKVTTVKNAQKAMILAKLAKVAKVTTTKQNVKLDSKKLKKKKAEMKTVSLGQNICVEAKSLDPVNFPYVDKVIKGVTKLIFDHKSGSVGCDKNRESNFGCKNAGFGIYITINSDDFAPDFEMDEKDSKIKVIGKTDQNKPVFWTIDGKQDSKKMELIMNSVTIRKSDLLQASYSEAKLRHNWEDNEGTTCFDAFAEYDASLDSEEEEDVDQLLIGDNICVDAKEKTPVQLPAVVSDLKDVTKLIFNHRSGYVGCDKDRESNFGCKDVGYGIFIVKNGENFAPDFEHDKELIVIGKTDSNQEVFWTIGGKQDSFRYENQMNKVEIKKTDKLGAVYSEARWDHNAGDNIGKTCFDVFVEFQKPKVEKPKEVEKEEEPKNEEKKDDTGCIGDNTD